MACVGSVQQINNIPGADFIVSVEVVCGQLGKWSGVCGKEINIGSKVTVFFQDAILPNDSRWSFMEKHNWRVKMCRFKGAPSECLIIPGAPDLPIGTDLSEALGVLKYEKILPASLQGMAAGNFPSFIPKTDEENYQRVPDIVSKMEFDEWYATEKADGTSCTVWKDENGLHVCSRNLELKQGLNVYWNVVLEAGFEKMPEWFAVQMEIIGPGIQSNPYKLIKPEGRVFTLFDIKNHKKLDFFTLNYFLRDFKISAVRLVKEGKGLLSSEELRTLADIKYPGQKSGEGIVIRDKNNNWSFKVLNLNYKS